MFQSIFFDYHNKTCYLRDDNEGFQEFQYYPTYYKIDPSGKYPTLDGKRANPTNKYDREDPNLYEKDVDNHLRILLDLYRESDDIPQWHNRVFLDIETVIGGAINKEYCIAAPAKMTAIALYDENTKIYYAYILDESSRIKDSLLTKDNTRIIPCSNERSLLSAFLDKWQELDPTIVIGYNSDNFDIPYLYNRIKRVLGESEALRLSPVGIVQYDDRDDKMPFKIAGINCLDFMRLYKKFIPRQRPSYSLDYISNFELGYGKMKYEGSLDNLLATDINKYIDYNVNDVYLLVKLEEKLRFVELCVSVCHKGHVPYHYVYQSSRLLEGVIMTFLKRKDIVSPNKPTTIDPSLKLKFGDEDDDKFAGAYVKEPIPGLYGWNVDFDETSLYPSIMVQLNSSPETFLFKIVKDDPVDTSWSLAGMRDKDLSTIIQIEDNTGTYKEVSIGKLVKIIEKNNIICSPNGTYFGSDTIGEVCEVVQEWFDLRKHYKNLMKDSGKKGDMNMYNFYNILQSIYKILLNSIYGCLGLSTFRYSDGKDIIAEAVTVSGRFAIINTGDQINLRINQEIFNDDESLYKDRILLSDTDSAFLSVSDIVTHRHPEIDINDDNSVLPIIRQFSLEMSDYLNEYYKSFTLNHFNTTNNRLDIKSETIGKKLYISAKKQYAQFIVEKEGVKMTDEKEQFDIKGLDFMKSSFPKLFKEFCQTLIKDILYDKPKSHIDKSILDFRDKFKTLPLEEAAKPTGINKLSEYLDKPPRKGTIFSSFLPKAPPNTKGATYYNDLLKYKQLDKQHPIIQVGDKIRWVYLKHNNPYNIEVLAYNEVNPPEEILEFMREYMDREALFDKNLVQKISKIYKNLGWGDVNYNRNVNKYIKYLN